jgi:hypothetical protein
MLGNGKNTFKRMGRFILIALISLVGLCSFAQYNSEPNLISRYKPGVMFHYTGLRPAEAEKAQKYDRLVFDITYNDWMGDIQAFNNRWSSIGLNTNFLFDIPLSKKGVVSLATGIRQSFFKTENLSNQFLADPSNNFTVLTNSVSTSGIKKRLLCGNAIGVPFELRFRTKGWKHVKLHVGGVVGYQCNIYSKTIYNGASQIEGGLYKNYDFADINRLALSTHVRLGIRNWAIYGSYGINSLFSNRSSAELRLFQLGISVSLF